ncbi:lysylphosphatidylglycerol synthase transmembrane domain-containing protein [Hylemonella gracilis]|uniref:lysylphosphatidylglycerol synthase transmembrane domain-containing protein n=1 Tax=Hylemonella gracilis TaxID=80880 RepID=UPI000688AAFF|nr:lysylphosphatidylglycerol synthase transmembrane domain-containing protein [Hylemonella gracilis]
MTARSAQNFGVQYTRLLRATLLFVLAGVLIYLALLLWVGWTQTMVAIRQLGAGFLLVLAALASTGYLWRFARWAWCLHMLGLRLPLWFNLRVYVSGLVLTTTPGKLGETYRSMLLLPYGVPVSHSLGAFLADRGSDVLGMCLLGVFAGAVLHVQAGAVWPWLLTSVEVVLWAASLLLAYAVLHPASGRGWDWLAAARLGRWHAKGVTEGGRAVLETWATLWKPWRVLAYALIACVAYGTQALVFAWICTRLDMPVGVANAVLIFVNAALFGAVSMVPGGLGAMEAALVLQLMAQGAEQASAVSAAIAVRLVTLWTGIALGLLALGGNPLRIHQRPK